jgi:hypothetical protein
MVRIKIKKPLPASSRMGQFEVMENCGSYRIRLSLFRPFPMMNGKSS